ncbi:RNA binding protein, heterogenous nuclear RNP-K like protein [Physocladia obscura]|uniref:RNA binding protein, heterogenous nuclear RNP-K like protein n=1 Tax=Physocladia obscura TaxID=109957 RepID=A0AAD5SPX1_9FUNG|nr:RNA binding protein, heterogenous nuclear RNP-K like protein [Physocladia obscura]
MASSTNNGESTLARLTGLTLNPPEAPVVEVVRVADVTTTAAAVEVDGENGAEEDKAEVAAAAAGAVLTLRALVSTKEAGVVIGAGGKNVQLIREATGVKAGVSKVVAGVHERVLSITGTPYTIAKAFAMIAQLLIDSPVAPPNPSSTASVTQTSQQHQFPDCAFIRVLVSHHLIGAIIGKGGARIRQIQEDSGAKVVVKKDMLNQSTERVVDVLGLVKSVEVAVFNIAQCVYNDGKPVQGVILYVPQPRESGGSFTRNNNSNNQRTGRFDNDDNTNSRQQNSNSNPRNKSPSNNNSEDQQTQTLSVPSDMVGCIIGKGGAFIANIRRQSGAKLRISELEEGGNAAERVVTIVGSAQSIAKALQLIYEQLDAEKNRRLNQERNTGSGNGRRLDGDD